jgi:asparagine synthase (glutamine-hydrolysing)
MRGIAGYLLQSGNASLDDFRAMCWQVRHRGPDGEGFHLDGGCALGMRRLSIIDFSGGGQPIADEDGTVWGA